MKIIIIDFLTTLPPMHWPIPIHWSSIPINNITIWFAWHFLLPCVLLVLVCLRDCALTYLSKIKFFGQIIQNIRENMPYGSYIVHDNWLINGEFDQDKFLAGLKKSYYFSGAEKNLSRDEYALIAKAMVAYNILTKGQLTLKFHPAKDYGSYSSYTDRWRSFAFLKDEGEIKVFCQGTVDSNRDLILAYHLFHNTLPSFLKEKNVHFLEIRYFHRDPDNLLGIKGYITTLHAKFVALAFMVKGKIWLFDVDREKMYTNAEDLIEANPRIPSRFHNFFVRVEMRSHKTLLELDDDMKNTFIHEYSVMMPNKRTPNLSKLRSQ